MLVLSRKRGESIRISNTIIISILDFCNGSIKIGIEAPANLPIYREELYQKIKQENRAAIIDEPQLPNSLVIYFKDSK